MNMQFTPGPWSYDNAGVVTAVTGKIIADVQWDIKMSIAEASANMILMTAATEMEHALRSFIAGMEGEEEFEGHNMEYLTRVCLPRAKEALKKAGILI